MPHLWMFLLKSLTPPEHKVFLIDGNAQPMNEQQLGDFIRENKIELVGIGAMTRMAARAYKAADAMRSAGAKVVFGGPHVTEVPDEPLGRTDEPRHADAVALGEADATWPRIVADAARGELQERYEPVDALGQEVKPDLTGYPVIPWEDIDLEQFNLISHVPRPVRYVLNRLGMTWKSLHVGPIESGRGCPYGCDFCTVTGFFGDSIRYRTDESVVDELLRLKRRARREGGRLAVFFIDDNFAINVKRTKSLLREIIARDAVLPWGGPDQRQPAQGQRTAGPDRGQRREVDLHRHGVDRPGKSGRSEQELQQAGRVQGSPRSPCQPWGLRHHVVHLWYGRR